MSDIALISLVALICIALAIAWLMISSFSRENLIVTRCFAASNLLFAGIAVLRAIYGDDLEFFGVVMALSALALAAYGSYYFLHMRVPTKAVVVIACVGFTGLVIAELLLGKDAPRLQILPILIACFSFSNLLYTFEPIRKEFGLLPAVFVAATLLTATFACANLLAVRRDMSPESTAAIESGGGHWYMALVVLMAVWLSLSMSYAYLMHTRSWRRLSDAAMRDGLTGLYSLSQFQLQSNLLWKQRRDSGVSSAVLAIDIDHFKAINDKHGHLAGNEILIVFSKILWSTFDRSALLGRTGGEEFGVILNEDSTAKVTLLVEQLMRRVARANCIDADGLPMPFTVSIGIAFDIPEDTEPEDILRRADKALYEAKRGGRDRFVYA